MNSALAFKKFNSFLKLLKLSISETSNSLPLKKLITLPFLSTISLLSIALNSLSLLISFNDTK